MGTEEFKDQYLPYQQKLYKVAFRLMENSYDAEDILQDAFIKLWNQREELLNVQNKEAFCVILVRNLCLDALRSKKRHLTKSLTGLQMKEEAELTNQLDAKSDLERVKYLITLLPEQQRKVLVLRHYDGCSFEEIEEITGLGDVHVRVLLSRARKKVRELFKTNQ